MTVKAATDPLELLANQPSLFPRWRRGYVFDLKRSRRGDGMAPTADKHLFVFEADPGFRNAGLITAVCTLGEHRTGVRYDHDRLLYSRNAPACPICQEVSEQHQAAQQS